MGVGGGRSKTPTHREKLRRKQDKHNQTLFRYWQKKGTPPIPTGVRVEPTK